ncbi:MAG: sigma-54 dependent transcriptional regulator [Myxococcota bacterium]
MLLETRRRSVLVVDDDGGVAAAVRRMLESNGCDVRVAHNVKDAQRMLEDQPSDACVIDYFLPDGPGADVARWAMPRGLTQVALCMTGTASTSVVVEAMRAGFLDVMEKPLDFERLRKLISFQGEEEPGSISAWRERFAPEIVGEDELLLEQLRVVESASDTDCTILVHGESGTGKELIASAIHRASPRSDGPFVALNCAALPENLVEAELFGHTKGAFTGAMNAREGKILAAHGGTLFLDEIGDLPMIAQAKLLRVLQERTVSPVGADKPLPVDVRIVAASHRDLHEMVERGTFRADLLYRLSVIEVDLPALRDRSSDILSLARHFIQTINLRTGRRVEGLDSSAEQALLGHTWPGNIRELMNTIERAVILKKVGQLSAKDLSLRARGKKVEIAPVAAVAVAPVAVMPVAVAPAAVEREGAQVVDLNGLSEQDVARLNLKHALEEVERRYIGIALEKSGGNRTEAAALLGLNRTTLVEKMRKLAG